MKKGKDLEILKSEEEIPAIVSDDLIHMAEFAEKRVEAIKRIKRAALAVTSNYDWVNQNEKPYLQVSGAEKIARLFGISWRIDEPEKTTTKDGHFSYIFKGYFNLGSTEIEAIGSRGSKDPFFSRSHDKDIPPSEINENNVRKAAYTNLLGNGITRLLGLRNLTWEDLKVSGIEKNKVGRVEYKKKRMSKENKELRDKIGSMLLEMSGNDKKMASKLLESITFFIAKDGKKVKGKKSLSELTEKSIPTIYGKVKKEYKKWKEEAKEIEKGKKESNE